jgi:hypothetical protein
MDVQRPFCRYGCAESSLMFSVSDSVRPCIFCCLFHSSWSFRLGCCCFFFSKQTLGRVQTYSEDGISADCYVPVKFQYAQDKKWFSVTNTSQLASRSRKSGQSCCHTFDFHSLSFSLLPSAYHISENIVTLFFIFSTIVLLVLNLLICSIHGYFFSCYWLP